VGKSSFQTAELRRAAYPHDEPYPQPTRSLTGPPPTIGAETTSYFLLPDGRQLFWRSVMPAGKPRGVMVFNHGYGDHSSFHLLTTAREYVSTLGVAAFLVDFPGHGRSDGLRVLLRDWTSLVVDTERWIDAVVEPARGAGADKLPLFAYGQSMGGAITIDLAMRAPDRFAGLILTAPMVRVAAEVRPHPVVESLLRHVVCRIPIVRDMALVPADGFVENVFAVEARWRMDEHTNLNPLNYSNAPTRLRTGLTMIDGSDSIAARLETLDTPFLVIHGLEDKTTAPALSEELHRRARAADKTLELLPNARHAIDFGEKPEVMEKAFALAFDWIKARMPTPLVAPVASCLGSVARS
jgi:alpha-beta hydrolase superfamily lysophospholipase